MATAAQRELGDFLRSRRERLRPEAVGLAAGRRRRTAGLRREEVAELAGIGIDWYVRLEQGRDVNPSAATLEALARALRLSAVEHTHLRALAAARVRAPFVREVVPDTLRRLVESLNQPAYLTGQRWDILAWNDAADLVFGFSRRAEADRNSLISVLTNPATRTTFADGWEAEARRMVGQFRATYDLWAGDPAFEDLVTRLRAGSPEFEAWWDSHDVGGPGAGLKLLAHPDTGPRRYEYASFQAHDAPTLRLTIYRAV